MKHHNIEPSIASDMGRTTTPLCRYCGEPINLVTYGSHGETYWRHNPSFRSRP